MPAEIEVRSILNKTKRRDQWFLDDYTVNLWSGCSFNCLFCYIRGSKYGTWVEEKVSLKSNGLALLEKQLALRAKKNQHGVIVLSSATDPYLHFEKEMQHTRRALEIIHAYRFPVHLLTRSSLVVRDFDLLTKINQDAVLPADLVGKTPGGLFLTFSFSTPDDGVAKIFEPGATPPSERIEALRAALTHGLHTGVSLMPLLPWITDTGENLHQMLKVFASTGVKYVFPSTLTLFGHEPGSSRHMIFRAVEKHYPHLRDKYQQLLGTQDYLPPWYQKAFTAKLSELMKAYGLRNSILTS